jgi:hypothetical protein
MQYYEPLVLVVSLDFFVGQLEREAEKSPTLTSTNGY